MTLRGGNALQVTRSSYGNALYYGLSMFAEFERLPYR